VIPCDVGHRRHRHGPDTDGVRQRSRANANGTLKADADAADGRVPHVFAAGDVVTGASDITRAVGQGRRAAHMIDRWLSTALDGFDGFDDRLPVVDKPSRAGPPERVHHRDPPNRATASAPPDRLREIEAPDRGRGRAGAGRCLDCGVCSECQECVDGLPADAMLDMRGRDRSSRRRRRRRGHRLQALRGRRSSPSTASALQERHHRHADGPPARADRPFNTVLRPGDGKVPERIAYVLCTGSRDETVDNPLCSRSAACTRSSRTSSSWAPCRWPT
jgi:hypothetical protein